MNNKEEDLIVEAVQPDYIGHRQRLKARFVTDVGRSMPDYEMLELLLMYAIPRRDVKPLAKELMRHYVGLANLLGAPIEDLMSRPGVGNNVAILLKLVHACANKMCWENLENKDAPRLGDKRRLVEYCRTRIGHGTREQLLIIYLNVHGEFLRDEIEQVGTLDAVMISPREVVTKALAYKASKLIIVHNHPSGDTTPSKMDIAMTKELKMALKTVEIKLEDHLIVSNRGYYSMRDHLPFMSQF